MSRVGQGLSKLDKDNPRYGQGLSKLDKDLDRDWTPPIDVIFHFKSVGQRLDSIWPRLDSNPSRFEAIKGRFPSIGDLHSSLFPQDHFFIKHLFCNTLRRLVDF